MVVLDVAGGKNSLPYHPAKRFDERLVVLLRIYVVKFEIGERPCGEMLKSPDTRARESLSRCNKFIVINK